MRKQKILLFGGNGFLGKKLIKELKNNFTVAPSHTELDLLQIDKVYELIDKTIPDVIIYTAGITRIDQAEADEKLAFTLNAEIPAKISQFISRQRTSFIYISSDAVFDGYTNKYMFIETDRPKPKSIYGKSKQQGEDKILNSNTNNTVIRLITLFGYDNIRQNFLTRTLTDLKNNKKIFGIIDQVQNPLYVEAAAQAISFSIKKQLSGIYHFGSLDWNTNYNFITNLADVFSLDKSLIERISFKDFMRTRNGYRKKKSVLLCEKFKSISDNKILITTNESFELLYKEYKKITQ